MLDESRLYSFLDRENNFTVHFLDGQKLIHDLAIIHDVKAKGFAYFRDSILTAQNLISLLKAGEGMGLFIDSIDPYFKLKIEMNFAGRMRTLLMPEEFNTFPKKITGTCRLSKVFPNNPTPYTSVIELNDIDFHQVVNKILQDSYQLKADIHISEESDQSVMVQQLPKANIDKEEAVVTQLSPKEYWLKNQKHIQDLFSKSTTKQEDIQSHFEALGFTYLGSKLVEFKCNCSRERMVQSIASLCNSSGLNEIFENKNELEAKCDYCKTYYLITKDEISNLNS
ncbi:putative chaperonin [Halobacteriovorax marinus SJ]|uniref:Chaperonin n=1 Tax=Halobacteriovorax marinus (strain ATCC BAA-682 / DSM 15412 / SJ) TaxID=862908 RepID=E1X393_HALMS|nr:Hsp33 family molecular chaperone HslO [Halobacteriovorax marinus]CBW25188.1 putative chaperonin [Halobacteriovorax marinus SJ]